MRTAGWPSQRPAIPSQRNTAPQFAHIKQHMDPLLIECRDSNTTITDAMIRAKACEIAQRLQIPEDEFKALAVGSRTTSIVPISGRTSGMGCRCQAAMRTMTARTMVFISTSSSSKGSENRRRKRQMPNSRPRMPKTLTIGFRQSTLGRLL